MPGAASRGCCSSERGGATLTQRGPAAVTQGMLDRMDHRGLVLTALAWTLASACASDGSVGPPSLAPLTSELHHAPQQTTLAGGTPPPPTQPGRDHPTL